MTASTVRSHLTAGIILISLAALPAYSADAVDDSAPAATGTGVSDAPPHSTTKFFTPERNKRLLIESAAGLAGGIAIGGGFFLAECLWETKMSTDPWCLLGAVGGAAGFMVGVPLGAWAAGTIMGADGYFVAAALGTLAGLGTLYGLQFAAGSLVAPFFVASPNSPAVGLTLFVLQLAMPVFTAVLVGGGTALAYEYSDFLSPRIRAWALEARLAPTVLNEGGGLAVVGTF